MRTTDFQSVYEAIVGRHGLDPVGDAITQDTARAITRNMNKRIRTALGTWPFLEFSHTEERAFRTVWNNTRQFYQKNPATGRPDEVFFIPDTTYYKVNTGTITAGDPPIGTLPTNKVYYLPLQPVDTFIEYDQPCKRAMGRVLGAYKNNPRFYDVCSTQNICVCYRPSEKGIDILDTPGPTVFVHYMLPEPKFTMLPYIAGKVYGRGARVLFGRDCFRSVADNNTQPPNTSNWTLEPFLESLALYVEAGTYSDCLRETLFNSVDEATRLARMSAAATEAEEHLHREIDSLISQGQLYYYTKQNRYYGNICVSQPWTGSTVSELTDECETDWIYPTAPPPTPSLGPEYHEEIVAIRTIEGVPSLQQLPTSIRPIKTLVMVVVVVDGAPEEQSWRLEADSANPFDRGQLQPDDYNALTNNKHWNRVA